MGLFGPSKVKITPNDFAENQLNKIFSINFVEAEEKFLQIYLKRYQSLK